MPTGTLVKSTIRSARSAGPISSRLPLSAVRLTGAARKPPSLPICQTSTPGIWPKSRIRKRDWQPFRKRKPVAPLLHRLERPGVAVDHDRVAEELGVPDRREVGVGDVRAGDPVEERARVRIEERPVGVERAILDGDRDLVVGLVGRELVVLLGRRARQHGGRPEPGVDHRVVAVGPAADEVEARRAGVDVRAASCRACGRGTRWSRRAASFGYWKIGEAGPPRRRRSAPRPCSGRSRTRCPRSRSPRGCCSAPAGTRPRRSRRSRRRRRRRRARA